MLSFLGSIISTVLGWFLGRKEAAGIAQGRAEQKVEDAKADIDVIHRANVAAKKVEQEEGANDANNLDRPR